VEDENPRQNALGDARTHTGPTIMLQSIGDRNGRSEQDQVLVREMQHRLKNTLAMVQAIVFQSFRSFGTKEQIEKTIAARLTALADAQDLLTVEGRRPARLRAIVERLVEIYDVNASRFCIDGPDVILDPKLGFALVLILHEMATNAVKYGALSNDIGHVELSWQLPGALCATGVLLKWAEVGGPAVSPPQRRGFGIRLIEDLLAPNVGIATEFAFERTGVVLTINAPLARMRAARGDGLGLDG
jgi:two-component sensor histidine kinase